MIADPVVLKEIRDSWQMLRESRDRIVATTNAMSAGQSSTMRDVSFNLLLVSALDLLAFTLRQLRVEGVFVSHGDGLGALMLNSRASLTWDHWATIDCGRFDRIESLRSQTFLPHAKCRHCVSGIERQLCAWGVLTDETPHLWNW